MPMKDPSKLSRAELLKLIEEQAQSLEHKKKAIENLKAEQSKRNSFQKLIPRPIGQAGRSEDRGGFNLERAMGVDHDHYKRLSIYAHKFLKMSKPFHHQERQKLVDAKIAAMLIQALQIICRATIFSAFQNSWPVDEFLKQYLGHSALTIRKDLQAELNNDEIPNRKTIQQYLNELDHFRGSCTQSKKAWNEENDSDDLINITVNDIVKDSQHQQEQEDSSDVEMESEGDEQTTQPIQTPMKAQKRTQYPTQTPVSSPTKGILRSIIKTPTTLATRNGKSQKRIAFVHSSPMGSYHDISSDHDFEPSVQRHAVEQFILKSAKKNRPIEPEKDIFSPLPSVQDIHPLRIAKEERLHGKVNENSMPVSGKTSIQKRGLAMSASEAHNKPAPASPQKKSGRPAKNTNNARVTSARTQVSPKVTNLRLKRPAPKTDLPDKQPVSKKAKMVLGDKDYLEIKECPAEMCNNKVPAQLNPDLESVMREYNSARLGLHNSSAKNAKDWTTRLQLATQLL
ncbi:hypothetical protein CVT25_013433, partial [Psilocybe cyanescens]